jgi:glucose-6-phosphate 1-dehydrogenase
LIDHLVILGATGDLMPRYLVPALVRLHDAGVLPSGFRVTGVGRVEWGDDDLRRHAARHLEEPASLVESFRYQRADVADAAELSGAFDDAPAASYLAMPPAVFAPAIEALEKIGLPQGSRVVIEKPFGQDLASARHLNELLTSSFGERAVFRIDHFLHLQTAQNILGLRFANRLFDAIWDRDHIERVEVVWDETLALEGRAGYYDRAGALVDMIQNHLLQVMSLVAMDAPPTLDEAPLRDAKAEVLRRVRRPDPGDVEHRSARARYTAGRIGERAVPAYVDEEGVDPGRDTETFAEVTLFVDHERWQGVPFTLRSGKALAENRHEVAVYLEPFAAAPFCDEAGAMPNVLRMKIEPDVIAFGINVNVPGRPFALDRAALDLELAPEDLPPYGRLLLDVLEGDPALSIRGDEAEEAWGIVEPVLDSWKKGVPSLLEYAAGSSGPEVETWR